MFDLGSDGHLKGLLLATTNWFGLSGFARTCILVVQFQEITLLVQLVGMAVQKSKNGLKLRNGIFADIHEGRLESLYYRQRAA